MKTWLFPGNIQIRLQTMGLPIRFSGSDSSRLDLFPKGFHSFKTAGMV